MFCVFAPLSLLASGGFLKRLRATLPASPARFPNWSLFAPLVNCPTAAISFSDFRRPATRPIINVQKYPLPPTRYRAVSASAPNAQPFLPRTIKLNLPAQPRQLESLCTSPGSFCRSGQHDPSCACSKCGGSALPAGCESLKAYLASCFGAFSCLQSCAKQPKLWALTARSTLAEKRSRSNGPLLPYRTGRRDPAI